MTDSNTNQSVFGFSGARAILVLMLLVVVTACGSETTEETDAPDATDAVDTTEAGQQEVSLRFNVPAYAPHPPFVYAAQQGFYEEEGLEVTFGEGAGSDVTSFAVAAGNDTFGTADFPGVTSIIALGGDIRFVGMIEQGSPLAITSRGSDPIETPQDLVGKTIVMGGGDEAMFAAFLGIHGLDLADVETVTMADEAQAAALAEGRVDGIAGWATGQGIELIELEGGIHNMLWSDHGLPMLNLGLVAHNDMIENDPETVCAFVRASFRGWEAAEQDPEAAVNALIEEFPNADFDYVLNGLQSQFVLMRSPSTEGLPLGQINPEDIQESMDLLVEIGAAEEALPVDEIYSNICFEE
jgi:NitT/TauT family transport system substrate-binding protein